ncbi:MAG TPA: DUF72 domain-containing protein [Cyclobacteriaceae bacterium]
MEFGRVDPADLRAIDFTLPPDRPETRTVLAQTKSNHTKPQFYIGCAKWGRKDWVGKIYPPKTKEADFLHHYSKQFNCIELNTTFYSIPTEKQTAAWKAKVGNNFMFCPKFVDEITHLRRLVDVKELTERFLEGISGFGDNLGPIFLMPHPGMGPQTLKTIQSFIQSLSNDIALFVELRHPEWFSNKDAFQQIFAMLENNKTGAVITDASGRRDCVHMRLTTPQAFIRFVGNGLHPTDYTRIDDWVQRIKLWMEQGIEKIYFFMHQHEELHSPELNQYLIQQLNRHCGTTIPEPKFIKEETDLFGVIPKKKKPGKS